MLLSSSLLTLFKLESSEKKKKFSSLLNKTLLLSNKLEITYITFNFSSATNQSGQVAVLKLVSAIFIKFLFFHQIIALQKLWKKFSILSKMLFSFSRYSNFCNFSLPFRTFQIQKNKWKWNKLWCHELTCINLQV